MTIRQPTIAVLLAVTAFMVVPVAAAQQARISTFPLDVESMQQWKLPSRLNEISGLALDSDERLFAVDDEIAAIYELDYEEGRIVKAFAFGHPVLRGDFEGIAVLDDQFWLTTSDGELFVGVEGFDGEQVDYDQFETGLGRECEIEGLAATRAPAALYLVCKRLRKNTTLDEVAIWRWSVEEERLDPVPPLQLPGRAVRWRLNTDRFNPSGITIDTQTGNFILVASRQHALVELTATGELVAARRFELINRHRQSEGIELTRDARLLISDEGGSRKARLAVYQNSGGQ